MDTEGCTEGYFSDQLLLLETGCGQSKAAWIALTVFIGVLNTFDVLMISRVWIKIYCTRRAYSESKRRNHCFRQRLPIIPMLRLMFLLLNLMFVILASFDIVSFEDGSSVAVLFVSLSPLLLYHHVTSRQYLRLGIKSIPLAKRLMMTSSPSNSDLSSSGCNTPTMPRTSSAAGVRLTRTSSLFGANDVSKLSPISRSVMARFYLWSIAMMFRLILGVLFVPVFPQNNDLITAAYAAQLVADVCLSFIVAQLGKSIKALDGILMQTSVSNSSRNPIGEESRHYLNIVRTLISVQLVISMAIHIPIMIGYRSWFIVLLEPASLSVFNIVHTFIVFTRSFRRRRRAATKGALELGNDKTPDKAANNVVVVVDGKKMAEVKFDLNEPKPVRQQPRSHVKGVRSEANNTAEKAEPQF